MRQNITNDYREYIEQIGAKDRGIKVFYDDYKYTVESPACMHTVLSDMPDDEIKETIVNIYCYC